MSEPLPPGRALKVTTENVGCTVCRGVIPAGTEAVQYTTQKWRWRHVGCQPVNRERSVIQAEAGSEEELRRQSQDAARAAGAKRRRSGGHGYSGGTNFTTM